VTAPERGRAIDFELPVHAVKARELALAVGERNPLCLDPEAARAAGLAAMLAPPTYPVMQGWEVSVDELQELRRVDYSRALHAEQAFFYERPLLVGEQLHGHCRLASEVRREGRSGGMTLITYRTDYTDAEGGAVATADYTLVELDESRPDPQRAAPPEPDPSWPDKEERGPVSRVDFARYAGASGDFHPMHTDEAAALEAGEPSVFAAGMMTAGLLAAAAGVWAGDGAYLSRFAVRIRDRVWPGDTLICEGGPAEGEGSMSLAARHRPPGGSGWRTAISGSADAAPVVAR
jgi:acyl dehydratase